MRSLEEELAAVAKSRDATIKENKRIQDDLAVMTEENQVWFSFHKHKGRWGWMNWCSALLKKIKLDIDAASLITILDCPQEPARITGWKS